MRKIIIDKNLCIGCGTCTIVAEKSFKLTDDGKAQPIDPPAGGLGDSEEKIQEAVDSCPVSAIKWQD